MFRSFSANFSVTIVLIKHKCFPMFLAICFSKKTWKQKKSIFLAIKTTVHFQHVSSQSQLQTSITATQVFPFFAADFPATSPPKNISFTNRTYIFSHFFAADFPATSSPKNISLKKIKHIFFSVFFAADFPATSPPKNISFKKIKLIFFSVFFAADFPATSPPKNISFKKIKLIFFQFFLPPIFPRPALKKI